MYFLHKVVIVYFMCYWCIRLDFHDDRYGVLGAIYLSNLGVTRQALTVWKESTKSLSLPLEENQKLCLLANLVSSLQFSCKK